MPSDAVLLNIENGVAAITLNTPRAGNVIDVTLAQALKTALHQCEREKDLRAIFLTGNGRFFCAGGDLATIHGQADEAPAYVAEILTHLHEAILIIARIPIPVIAGVHGAAAGAGLALAASCDLAIATQSARFMFAYGRVGLTPDGSASWYLPRLIGTRRALELALLNRELSAAEACNWGLVNEVVADDALTQRLSEIGRMLRSGPAAAHAQAKRLLRQALDNSLSSQMDDECKTLCDALKGREAAIGMDAFLKKTQPDFS